RPTRSSYASGSAADVRVRAPPGQMDDHRVRVVRLVRLPDVVEGVGPLYVGEGAVQAPHVDPLLVIGRGVHVRPADRGAERDAPLARILVARRVVRAPGR